MTLRGWALFAGMSLAWGVPYLFIKIAVDDGLSPGFVAWSRVALATLVLLPVALKAGALRRLPLGWLVLFAITEICIPFPLIGFGETRVSSSLAAILIASLPADGGLPGPALRSVRAAHARAARGHADRVERGGRTGGHRHRRHRRGADRRRGDPGRHARLRVRPADRQAPAERRRSARTGDRRHGHRHDHPPALRDRRLPRAKRPRATRSSRWWCWGWCAQRSPS